MGERRWHNIISLDMSFKSKGTGGPNRRTKIKLPSHEKNQDQNNNLKLYKKRKTPNEPRLHQLGEFPPHITTWKKDDGMHRKAFSVGQIIMTCGTLGGIYLANSLTLTLTSTVLNVMAHTE